MVFRSPLSPFYLTLFPGQGGEGKEERPFRGCNNCSFESGRENTMMTSTPHVIMPLEIATSRFCPNCFLTKTLNTLSWRPTFFSPFLSR